MGFYCGYVGVPENHPYYGKNYDDVDLNVHGGLTYGDFHYLPDDEKLWWFGFDCGHAWDFCPYMYMRDIQRLALMQRTLTNITDRIKYPDWSSGLPVEGAGYNTYKDFEFVKEECRSMIRQLRGEEQHTNDDE